MKRLAKFVGILFLVLLVLAGGLAGLSWHVLRTSGERIRAAYAAGLTQVRPAFLGDQELVVAHPILAPAGRSNDAGPVLNPRIGWDGDEARTAKWKARLLRRQPTLTLDQAMVARIPKEWWTTPPEVWKDLDFGWLGSLATFDHWDVESNSPWADAPAGDWPNGFPLFSDLTPWMKLRLAKGLAEGHPADATAEVEHLAALLLSTETLLGAAVGLAALERIDEASAILERQGRTAPRSERMDSATRARAFRATMAARVFLMAETPPSFRTDAEKIVVGRCAALNEALRSAMALWVSVGRESGKPLHWLPLDGTVASGCRLTWLRRALAGGPPPEPAGKDSTCDAVPAGLGGACKVLRSIPVVASLERALAQEVMVQMELANASPLSWYEDQRSDEGGPCEPAK